MKPETSSFYELAVQRAVEQIVADLDRALDLRALARGAALSSFHFHRVFRGAVGETPLELQRRLRMERAAWQLRYRDDAVTTIAFAAGYETHESFTRAFRSHYVCSPSEFRQSRTPEACVRPFQIELAARSGIHFRSPIGDIPKVQFIQGEEVMDVDIKEMPVMRVATTPHVGPYNRIAEAFARLGEVARGNDLLRHASAMLAIYHDDPDTTPSAELHSQAALVVSPEAKLPPELGEQELPAGRYATTTHIGPYEALGDVWARFMGEWLPRSGERIKDGVSFEIYRNTPGEVPKEKLRTELYIPLE
jgi:AraC family transcriptional regulator